MSLQHATLYVHYLADCFSLLGYYAYNRPIAAGDHRARLEAVLEEGQGAPLAHPPPLRVGVELDVLAPLGRGVLEAQAIALAPNLYAGVDVAADVEALKQGQGFVAEDEGIEVDGVGVASQGKLREGVGEGGEPLLPPGPERQVRALRGEPPGARSADAGARTGHQRQLPFQSVHGSVPGR